MYRPFSLIIIVLFSLISITKITAQNRTYSPYSRYGLGELVEPGYNWNNSMGGVGIGVAASDRLNNLNPSSYSSIDSLSFYFDIGLSGNIQNFSSSGSSKTFADTNFDYLTFGFPLHKRVGLSLGVKPAAQSGYKFQAINEGSESSIQTSSGFGNITSVYGGLGYNIFYNLSLGVNLSYWFGDVYHKTYIHFPADSKSQIFGIKNEHTMSALLYDFGAQYTLKLSDKQSITIGATYTPEIKVNGTTERLTAHGTVTGLEKELFTYNNIIESQTDTTAWEDTNFKFPSKIGGGISYTIKDKLLVAADYSIANWGSVTFPDNGITKTVDASKLSLGVEWTPNERTGRKYVERIKYRAGFSHATEYVTINGYQLNNTKINVGFGLPLSRTKTSINIGYSLGMRGTTMPNGLRETYHSISLGVFMHEVWFYKRKFN